jgi:GT2 family glycosyltransferase
MEDVRDLRREIRAQSALLLSTSERCVVERSAVDIDVIVCVHDALDDVRRCLAALQRTAAMPFRLRLVNDGSGAATAEYLRAFAAAYRDCTLEENPSPLRYTAAANQALRRCTGDYVVLLNSDTIVPHDWLTRLIDLGERSPHTGLLGPLSNAATWQSVPVVHDEHGDWMVNEIPPALSVEGMAALVAACAPAAAPSVPMLNGFCLAIKRAVIDRIGRFDEDSFPDGYGEEIDYCFRAADAGFRAAIADTAYVFHAKSRSYGHDLRRELARRGRAALDAKYGAARLRQARESMREDETLALTRSRVRTLLDAVAGIRDPLDAAASRW